VCYGWGQVGDGRCQRWYIPGEQVPGGGKFPTFNADSTTTSCLVNSRDLEHIRVNILCATAGRRSKCDVTRGNYSKNPAHEGDLLCDDAPEKPICRCATAQPTYRPSDAMAETYAVRCVALPLRRFCASGVLNDYADYTGPRTHSLCCGTDRQTDRLTDTRPMIYAFRYERGRRYRR